MKQVHAKEQDICLLIEIGFTKTQAKVYLTLLGTEENDARTLSKKTGIPKPEIYRTVKELQEKGLVEKELTVPSKFIATPIQFELQILINQKAAYALRDPVHYLESSFMMHVVKKREKVTRYIGMQSKKRTEAVFFSYVVYGAISFCL